MSSSLESPEDPNPLKSGGSGGRNEWAQGRQGHQEPPQVEAHLDRRDVRSASPLSAPASHFQLITKISLAGQLLLDPDHTGHSDVAPLSPWRSAWHLMLTFTRMPQNHLPVLPSQSAANQWLCPVGFSFQVTPWLPTSTLPPGVLASALCCCIWLVTPVFSASCVNGCLLSSDYIPGSVLSPGKGIFLSFVKASCIAFSTTHFFRGISSPTK